MSNKHITAARYCPMFKGNVRLMLFVLCDRAGSGARFKNGKKSVFGWTPKLSDKTLMRSLNCSRRESIRQWRAKLRSGGAIQTKLVKQVSGWPVYRYFVDIEWLEKQAEESEGNASVLRAERNPEDNLEGSSSCDVDFERTKTVRTTARKSSEAAHEERAECRTENAALSGLPTEVSSGTPQGSEWRGGGSRLSPTSESVSGTGVTEAEAEAEDDEVASLPPSHTEKRQEEGKETVREQERKFVPAPKEKQHSGVPVRSRSEAPTPKDAAPPSRDERNLLNCADLLAKVYYDLFPTHDVDSAHFAVLMRRGHDPFDIESVIKDFLPVTNFPGIESSADFMLAYKELARQYGVYQERGVETCTESRMASWIEKCRSTREDAADFEKLETAFNRDDVPIDPEDAAEEASWLAADQAIEDGDAAELDPMQDAFAGEREDAEFKDGMHDAFIDLPLAPLPPVEIPTWKVLASDDIPYEVWEKLAKKKPERPRLRD